jgi:hypothetical protein
MFVGRKWSKVTDNVREKSKYFIQFHSLALAQPGHAQGNKSLQRIMDNDITHPSISLISASIMVILSTAEN